MACTAVPLISSQVVQPRTRPVHTMKLPAGYYSCYWPAESAVSAGISWPISTKPDRYGPGLCGSRVLVSRERFELST